MSMKVIFVFQIVLITLANPRNNVHRDDQADDIDDAKTEVYLEDLQHMVDEAKNMVIDQSFNTPIVEMNLKLREDLTKAFECYITLLTKCDHLQRDKIQ